MVKLKLSEIFKTPGILMVAIFYTLFYALVCTVFLRELMKFKTVTLNPHLQDNGLSADDTPLGKLSYGNPLVIYVVCRHRDQACDACVRGRCFKMQRTRRVDRTFDGP